MEGKELSRLFDKKERLEDEKKELVGELHTVEEDLVQVRLDIQNFNRKTGTVDNI